MIKTFEEAQQFIYKYIGDPKKKFAGSLGLKRAKNFLNLLGNPQNKLKIIHVAGTSGKGSTAFYISNILKFHGFKVGLTVSPHLVDLRERIQINNQLISKDEFVSVLNKLIPVITYLEKTDSAPPSYFMIMLAIFFYTSLEHKVDYAVVETGLGGTYDGTNTVDTENKICVITKIGLDHTEILGNTIPEIASQKAGIIQAHNLVIKSGQEDIVNNVFKERVKEKNGEIFFINKDINFKSVKLKDNKINFNFRLFDFQLDNILLNTNAFYQVENSSLAIAATYLLSKRDRFNLDKSKLIFCLSQISLSARMQTFKVKNKKLILDGAHNPQKMASFVESLMKAYPKTKYPFLVAFKDGKDFVDMLKNIIPVASKIIITSYQVNDYDLFISSVEADKIVAALKKLKFTDYQVILEVDKALNILLSEKEEILVATGSFYLLSKLYKELL